MRYKRKIAQSRCRHAFTLVELLVVISIIALLLAILMPSLQKAREQARRIVCATNLHNLHMGFTLYDTSNGKLPPGNWAENARLHETAKLLVTSYGVPKDAIICPSSDRKSMELAEEVGHNWEDWGLMTYTYFGGEGLAWKYYAGDPYNNNVPGLLKNGWYITPYYWWRHDDGYFPPPSIAKCKNPSSMPMAMDITIPASYEERMYWVGVQRSNHKQKSRTGENLIYYDGHVEWQWMIEGVSWSFGNDYYIHFYTNDNSHFGKQLPATSVRRWVD